MLSSICFVAQFAYGALCGGVRGHCGGIEHQQSLMARWLVRRGYRVSMVTWDEGQADGEEVDGVRVFKMCRQDAGWPVARFVHPRWTGLWRAMSRADADLYYQNCAECTTGQVAMWCRRHGRRFVYSVASEPDCDASLYKFKRYREKILYRYGLTHADHVIVQTRKQQTMLREGFGIEATPIPMPCIGPEDHEYEPASAPRDGRMRVLWVGRIHPVKRVEWLVEMARSCPEVAFDLLGQAGPQPYADQALRLVRQTSNIEVHGHVPHGEMASFYRRANCLCCTSLFEGFPNTFLEAWSHGLPVVSTFDPDGLIQERELGLVAGDVAGLRAAIRTLSGSVELWRRLSANGRRYFVSRHRVEAVMPVFEQLFQKVFAGGGGRGRSQACPAGA